MKRLIVVFLDGVGIGVNDPAVNPFFRAQLPNVLALFGGLPELAHPVRRVSARESDLPPATTFPLDANLGMEGTPQSGTGQTTLLTGVNGAERFGRHFGPWVPTALRDTVREESFLLRGVRAGHRVAFANAYPVGWPGERGGRRVAGPPLAAQGAGLLTRTHLDLSTSQAVSSEMTNGGWKKYLGFNDLPDVTAEQAGATLASIGWNHQLTLYAHYATDTAGHRGGMEGAIAALEKVDEFLGGMVSGMAGGAPGHADASNEPDTLDVLICSDHGNIEDVTGGHTRNPALGALIGPAALAFDPTRLSGLADIPSWVLEHIAPN